MVPKIPILDPDDYKQIVQATASVINGDGKQVWLAKVLPTFDKDDPLTFTLDDARNAVITQYNIRLVHIANASSGDDRFLGPDFYTFFYDDTSLYADHIHPNDLGYQRMGDKWHDILRP